MAVGGDWRQLCRKEVYCRDVGSEQVQMSLLLRLFGCLIASTEMLMDGVEMKLIKLSITLYNPTT